MNSFLLRVNEIVNRLLGPHASWFTELHREEKGRVALFLLVIITIYVVALIAIVQWLRGRNGGAGWMGRFWRVIRIVALASAAAGTGCIVYGYAIEPYWPEITHLQLSTTKLAAGSKALRIVQISDLHCDGKPRLEPRLPELIAHEHPDLIVYTGDSADRNSGVGQFRDLIAQLQRIAPLYAVQGNWDLNGHIEHDPFASTQLLPLRNQSVTLDLDNRRLWIGGVAMWDEPLVATYCPRTAFCVLLEHSPDWAEDVRDTGVDLYLAGHTHGGQVALPWYGALATSSRFGKRYERGLYRVGNMWLYVNRGIGMNTLPFRFLSRPEITVFDITPASSQVSHR